MSTRNANNPTPLQSKDATALQTANDNTHLDSETFDEIGDELSGETRPSRNGALWLALSLLAFYSVFSLGVWSRNHSSQPPQIGPFSSRQNLADAKIFVHVAGAVARPGVYVLPHDARVFQAIEKAGGALPKGETDALNLADWAQDGARIEVSFKKTRVATSIKPQIAAPQETPKISPDETVSVETSTANSPAIETVAPTFTPPQSSTRIAVAAPKRAKTAKPRATKKPKAQSKTVAGLPRALTPKGELSDNASPQYLEKHPLDLNKISREQLEALPGVGPSLAQKILDYRAQNNGFKNVEELDNVSGIGEKKLAALKPLLYVANTKPETSPSPKAETN